MSCVTPEATTSSNTKITGTVSEQPQAHPEALAAQQLDHDEFNVVNIERIYL